MKELKERKEKEGQDTKEEHKQNKRMSLCSPISYMDEMESLKGDHNALNCCSYSHLDLDFHWKNLLTYLFLSLCLGKT